MAVYAFETITEAQALAFSSADSLTVSSGSARATTVLFLADGTFSVTIADRTLIFSSTFQHLNANGLKYSDNSELYVGSPTADTKTFIALPPPYSTGAMYGGAGDDTLTGSRGDWLIQGNQGDDVIKVYEIASNTIYGGQGNDYVQMILSGSPSGHQFMQGNKGNDTLQGGLDADTLLGGQGDDVINGTTGLDFVNGNLGNDTISGSGQVFGEGGNDNISGGSDGPSLFRGGDGDDIIRAGGGSGGTAHHHFIYGDAGNDQITSSNFGLDEIHGGEGDDLFVVVNNLSLTAPAPGDLLFGEAGNDTIHGGSGADTINGGEGADMLAGGDGADLFILTDSPAAFTFATTDRILDWSKTDHIRFTASEPLKYVEGTYLTFDDALQEAQHEIAAGRSDIVSIRVGPDIIVFADSGSANTVGHIAILVGRSLTDVSADNFI